MLELIVLLDEKLRSALHVHGCCEVSPERVVLKTLLLFVVSKVAQLLVLIR